MNVCTIFHVHPSSSCRGIHVKPTNVNLVVALEEKSGEVTKVNRIHCLGTMTVCMKSSCN